MPTALVTGASAGIGAAVAQRLAGAGYTVYGAARRVERVQALPGVRALPMDLRDEASILAGFEAIREQVGGVDLLVNNAGLGHKSPLTSGETEQWREMLEVNVLALCVCTREAVSDMRRRGDAGHVVHVSSMAAHRVPEGSGVYSATKYAVRSLTEGLRMELRELGSAIRVTAISPGFVETEFAERYHKSAEAAARTYGRYPVLQPEDVAEAVMYAVSAPPHVQVHDLLMRPTQQPR
ncbi:MAG: SDR family NAD(P)-dependent oxidoreductase [Alphaproteobacteria bacterium]|nr:SDR family NAD(P)-dependent oxidoreductase [Alphaproteobacteria bacterium]MCB9796804.1 SDR family NAD(P)-dependent oxidoreductase [Alphaproteobacteria bacterium]